MPALTIRNVDEALKSACAPRDMAA